MAMRIARYFETLLEPTALPPDAPPPSGLVAFYWHYARQAKFLVVALFVAGFAVAILDTTIPGAPTVITPGVATFFGLPVTGFMVTARTNSSVACTLPGGGTGTCSGNYAGLFEHSYRTVITP